MGTVFRRKNKKGEISYTARVRKRGYPEQIATFPRKSDADDWIKQEEIKIRQGIYFDEIEAKKHTLGETIDRYTEEVKPHPNRALHLTRWKDRFGARYLSSVNEVVLDEAIRYWKKHLNHKPATSNRHLDSLSVVMKAAKKWGWLKRNPISEVERMKEPRGRVRYLNNEELKRLLTECNRSKYKHLYFIVVLALSTGMRKEELLSLTWRDVDTLGGVIILQRTKNGERRRVHVKGTALQLLKSHAKIRCIDSEFLFPGEKDSPEKDCVSIEKSKRHFDIRKPWKKAVSDAKLPDFRYHDLRHTCASYLAMNGATPFEIAEVLGHKDLASTQRYTHLADTHTSSVVERMNDKFLHLDVPPLSDRRKKA